jgi:uncharacterized membrane protein
MTRAYWIAAIGMTAAALAASAALYPGLPARVPTHWGLNGEVDGYGPKGLSLFLIPTVMVGLLGLFAALPWLSPQQFQVDSFRRTYLFIMTLIVGLEGYIHGVILYATARPGAGMGRPLLAGIFLFFALLGNVLGKVRRNFFIGVRTPWTLASERVWTDTHRLASWLFVACGLLGFALAMAGYVLAALAALTPAIVVPVVHSLVLYKRLERRGEV